MKKIIIAIVALFVMGTAANAQLAGIGARFGGGQGYNAELSTLWSVGNRLEVDFGWGGHDYYHDFALTGIYQWTGNLGASGFGWFAGIGARVGYWRWSAFGQKDHDIALAVAGQFGLEYKFSDAPIQLSLDIRPCYYFVPDMPNNKDRAHWGDIALGIRYML